MQKIWSTRKTRIDKDKILKLRKEGLTYTAIGKKMGCSFSYASDICNPKRVIKKKEYSRKRNNERYHKDHNYRKKCIKATTSWIMDKYKNCPAFREKQREYDHKKWMNKKRYEKDILFEGFAKLQENK
jgi:hypothetical protein